MCRFLGYLGSKMLLADAISRPVNSLIRQSYRSQERSEPLNGDGFGIGWYSPDVSDEACVFTSITPAWSNRNLVNLTESVRSACFFAHIRAASPGMAVAETNCHPFRQGRYLWMHNGTIAGFTLIKRRLRRSLPDRLYHAIEGSTDSEHAFAVFLHLMDETAERAGAASLANAMVKTIGRLEEWVHEAGIREPSIYNFAVTDGQNMVTVRYVSDATLEPISLYFSKPGKLQNCDGKWGITECSDNETGVMIASERLTDDRKSWTRVAPNHVVTVDSELNTTISLIPGF